MLQAKLFYKAKRVLYHTLSHFFWKIHSQQLTKFEGKKKVKIKNKIYIYSHSRRADNDDNLVYSVLTPCRLDGLLIKYPQFSDVSNALNVQPRNIFLLTV